MENIQPNIDYWHLSIVVYVLGANPPSPIMEGFIRRVWSKYEVDKGVRALEKIVTPVGKLIKLDDMTTKRDILNYARATVEEKDQTKPAEQASIVVNEEPHTHASRDGMEILMGKRLNRFRRLSQAEEIDWACWHFIAQQKVGLAALLETKVKAPNLGLLYKTVFDDISCGGNFFTWSNKQDGDERVFSKIDRVTANERWLDSYSKAHSLFVSEGPSDHCPAHIKVTKNNGGATEMYSLTNKLKQVKGSLKELNKIGFGSIQAVADMAYQNLMKAQEKVHNDPKNAVLIQEEKGLPKLLSITLEEEQGD
ncbi:Retinoblastoma-associated protein [Bienertia sinuspersici]